MTKYWHVPILGGQLRTKPERVNVQMAVQIVLNVMVDMSEVLIPVLDRLAYSTNDC